MTCPSQDRALLEAFRRGERDALARLYRAYAADVARLLRAGFMYSQNGETKRFPGYRSAFELEGAVQEVFTRAFAERARQAYDGVRPYATFLYGIAKNVALDDLRKRARRGEVLTPLESAEGAIAGGGAALAESEPAEPEASLDERRGRDLVHAFLAEECDDRDRRLFDLRYRDELSQEAAASEADLTRIQLRRWEAKLKRRLLRYMKRRDYVRGP